MPTIEPRPLDEMRAAGACRSAPVRRYRSPHTTFPHAQFLSNGTLRHVGHQRRRRQQRLARPAGHRWRRDATRDADGQFIYLRDVRSGAVWSATYQPTARRARRLRGHVLGRPGQLPPARRRHHHPARRRGLDRRRRRSAAAHGASTTARASARSTSPATPRSCWRGRPTISRTRPSASCSSRPSTCRTAPRCSAIGGRAIPGSARGRCTAEPRGPAAGAGRMGNRSRALPRPRPRTRTIRPRSTAARCRARPASCSIPIVSLRQRIRLVPGAIGAALFRHRHGRRSRDRRGPGAEVPRSERGRAHLRAGVHARAERPAPSGYFRATRRCCSSGSPRACSAPTARCARAPRRWPPTSSARPGLAARDLRRPADPARARRRRRRRRAGAPGAAGAGVLAPEGPDAPTSSSSTSIPSSYLDEMQAQLTALLDDGPWRTWQHRPGGAYLLRADRMGTRRARAARSGGARRAARRSRRSAHPARRGPIRSGTPAIAAFVPTRLAARPDIDHTCRLPIAVR